MMKISKPSRCVLLGSALLATVLTPDPGHTAVIPAHGVSGTPQPLVVSREQQESWVRDFNPFKTNARFPTWCGVYETLMIFNLLTGEYEPWLATSYAWDVTDHIVTFELRKQVRWSDGHAFSAEDVVFTFNLLHTYPEIDANGIWEFLREVRAENSTRVSFVFKHTFVPGLEYLSSLPIIPRHGWDNVADPVGYRNENPVGTGPFTEIVSFTETVWELGANPYYWQAGKPAVRVLRFPLFSTNRDAVAALIDGTVDWSGNFVPHVEKVFEATDPEHHVSWSPLVGGSVFLLTNTTRSPFDDVRVRKAISMAIDRERVVHEAMLDYTRPTSIIGLSDALQRFHSQSAKDSAEWTIFDTKAAATALDKAGYQMGSNGVRTTAKGEALRFDLLIPRGWSDWLAAGDIIAEELAAVGIKITVKPTPYAEWLTRGELGKFDLIMRTVIDSTTPYPTYFWLMSSRAIQPVGRPATSNWHRFGNADADALLEALEMTREDFVRQVLFQQLQHKFVDLAPAIPLFQNPAWGSFNSTRFVGFPSESNPYAVLSPNRMPSCSCLDVLTNVAPRVK